MGTRLASNLPAVRHAVDDAHLGTPIIFRSDIVVMSGGQMIKEREGQALPGWPALVVIVAASVLVLVAAWWEVTHASVSGLKLGTAVLGVLVVFGWRGLTAVNPNEARALVLFGSYAGSVKRQGLWWVNPFARRLRISVKVRNFESQKLKVNDHDGNPIEIAAVVVWRVVDTAEALFEVDDYEQFLRVQAEAAIRTLATAYPYDGHGEEQSLRGNPHEVGEELKREVQGRLERAGIEVLDTRISLLAYAPEIAGAMLRRQQASAIIDARTRIVGGAVSMVQMALEQLSSQQIVELDEERKAAMVSNLLVVLCSERESQPVVNAGSLY
jgi:regulator of protease activity HflC (stomatin/prohibitin superfamily)